MLNLTKKKLLHLTTKDVSFAHEQKGNWYYWDGIANAYLTVDEDLKAFESHKFHGTPITEYNNWPERVSNHSIFKYLFSPDNAYGEFNAFVKEWHKSSCAIIYKNSDNNEGEIIGSGSLTNIGAKDCLCVVTARHNFQDLEIEKLFIRFFKYNSVMSDGKFVILEDYIDMPVIKSVRINYGLDAGYLLIPQLQDKSLFGQYAKCLPIDTDDTELKNSPLPSGKYVMFHFAGGLHQVSLGEIEASLSYKLNDDVVIQAGSGASGAVAIWYNAMLHQTKGMGISVYRIIEDRCVRRLISFSEFTSGPRADDEIRTPYRDQKPSHIAVQPPTQSGYEFKLFRGDIYYGMRTKTPDHDEYKFTDYEKFSNHHIIPIADLLYLWDYFFELDKATIQELHTSYELEETSYIEELRKNLFKDHKSYEQEDRNYMWKKALAHISDEGKKSRKNIYNPIYLDIYQEKVKKPYKEFMAVITNLCSPNQEYFNNNWIASRSWFAWSWWNLFKGWGGNYREGDPKNALDLDFSEKVKPNGFDQELWNLLKSKPDGLYCLIQELKKAKSPNQNLENRLYDCLNKLDLLWNKTSPKQQKIHAFDKKEWAIVGYRNSHPIYKLEDVSEILFKKDLDSNNNAKDTFKNTSAIQPFPIKFSQHSFWPSESTFFPSKQSLGFIKIDKKTLEDVRNLMHECIIKLSKFDEDNYQIHVSSNDFKVMDKLQKIITKQIHQFISLEYDSKGYYNITFSKELYEYFIGAGSLKDLLKGVVWHKR